MVNDYKSSDFKIFIKIIFRRHYLLELRSFPLMLTTVLLKKSLTNFYVQTQGALGFEARKQHSSFGGTFSS